MGVRSLAATEYIALLNGFDNFAFWSHGFKEVITTDTAFSTTKTIIEKQIH